MCFLFQARCRFPKRVPEVVVGERREDHAQGIGFVVKCGRARRKGALARRAAPQLNDLQLLLARAAAREILATAVGAGLRLLRGQWNPSDAGDGWRHTINSMCSPYHAAHGNRKASARNLDEGERTDFARVALNGERS